MAFITGTRTNRISLGNRLTEIFSEFAEAYTKWRLYRRTLNELQELSTRELDDLGLNRSSIQAAAYEAAYGAAR
jgi:uncharacterized protein YjiS (DUF1127 family)